MARGKMIMKFIKKLFQKKKGKKLEEKQESWYNNSHEKIEKSKWNMAESPGALSSPNSVYVGISHANERK